MTTEKFSKRLADLLYSSGHTQTELAKYLRINPATVSVWISGKGTPQFDKLDSIARFFHMTTPDLLSDIDPDEAKNPTMTVLNVSQDLQQIPYGAYISVEIGCPAEIGDILLYKSGEVMRFLRLVAYKDGISVLMSDIDNDPPVIAKDSDMEILGVATAILLRQKETASDGNSEAALPLGETNNSNSTNTIYHD